MAVYVDEAVWQWRGMLWCHMTADTLDELHDMAGRLGLKRGWYQGPPKTRYAHYDTISSKRLKALKLGVVPVDDRVIVTKAKALAKLEIFVFGSNLAGRHGKGSAFHAAKHYGAEYGVGEGPTGRAYAIPTKDAGLCVLPLKDIRRYVGRFRIYAREHPELHFTVVEIGCGLAGYSESDILPMFRGFPDNCTLPEGWSGEA